jgi:hypothetical protein
MAEAAAATHCRSSVEATRAIQLCRPDAVAAAVRTLHLAARAVSRARLVYQCHLRQCKCFFCGLSRHACMALYYVDHLCSGVVDRVCEWRGWGLVLCVSDA